MQFLLLFSLNTLLALFQFDGWRGDIEQPKAKTVLGTIPVVKLKVWLEGPYSTATSKMTDNLRTNNGAATDGSANLIPTTEPYSSLSGFTHVNNSNAGQIIASSVFATTGDDAIVDWVFVELRSTSDPAVVYATTSALLQVDGDIVSYSGNSTTGSVLTYTTFGSATVSGSYYVAIRHRNHLGVRTSVAVALGVDPNSPVTLDFTAASPSTTPAVAVFEAVGLPSRKTLSNNALAMYSGDANRDGLINVVDKNSNWRTQNLSGGLYVQNGGTYTYFTLTADFNLSGNVNVVDKNSYWRINNLNGITQQL